MSTTTNAQRGDHRHPEATGAARTSTFGHGAAARLIRRTSVIALAGTLALASIPTSALAAQSQQAPQASASQGAGQPGEPPSGDAPTGAPGNGANPSGGANTMSFDYSGTYSGAITADGTQVSSDGESFDASEADENAALAENGGALALTGATLTKSGDDTNGDNCNFYGVNSVLLSVGEGSLATVSGSELSSTSEGSNAIFATDSATVYANDVRIDTTAGNSRGLDATYGGTIIANGVTATTQGDHSAAVATDRGGGSVSLTNSTLSTAGSGSPLLYSTGDIEVSGVTGTASGSQIAAMEGLNTILVNNSTLESTNTNKTASDPVANGIIIYQSTSGDAESTTGETATFQAAGSTLKSAITSGSMFYLTNTSADVVLARTSLDYDSGAADLIMAVGNDSNNWGTAGSNGATVRFTGIEQQLTGNIEADTISSVDLHLTRGSIWTGSASITDNANGATSDAPITVNVDGTSSWVVTDSCTISALNVASGAQVVDENGNTVTIVAGGQTVVQGDSDVTMTCDSYSTDYDASEAGTLSDGLIDRSDFDEQMGTSTTWSMGDQGSTTQASATQASSAQATTSTQVQAEASSETSENPIIAFFQWLGSLLGF